jgi:hypothetical protein
VPNVYVGHAVRLPGQGPRPSSGPGRDEITTAAVVLDVVTKLVNDGYRGSLTLGLPNKRALVPVLGSLLLRTMSRRVAC